MLGLHLPRIRSAHRPSRPNTYVVSLLATLAVLVAPTVASAANAPTQFDPALKTVSVSGTFANVRDNRGGVHAVSLDARWNGTRATMTTVNGPGSKSKERSATATARIVFDGTTLVDGAPDFPFPAPFIRVDIEK